VQRRRAAQGGGRSRRRSSSAGRSKTGSTTPKREFSAKLEQMDASVDKKGGETLQAKLDAIDKQYAKLFRDIDDYSKKTNGKGLVGGLTIQQVKDHIVAQKDILKSYATLEDKEGRINDLEKERKSRLDEIADEVARGIIKPEDGLAQSNAVIDEMAPKIASMAADALAFAEAFAQAHPSEAMTAFIAKMRATLQNNSGGQNVRAKNDVAQAAVDAQTASLNKLVADRNALVEHENQLVQAGLETYSDAQKKIQGFYNETNGLIKDQIALILRLADSWKTGTPEQQRAFAALSANLANVSMEAQGTDASFVNLKAHVTDILSTNIVQSIDTVAQSFAKLVTQQESVMGFLADIGRAFIQLIANVLQTVATLIIEALVLDAVDKATGGILKPLLQMTAAAVSIRHEGGVIGDVGGRSRQVSPLAFANAPRYHTGGIAGLAPNEHAAILKKGEEVLTENDPRHRDNGGLSGGQGGGDGAPARAILAVGDEQIAAAMTGAAGEKVFLYHMQRNRGALKQAVQ
jgi:hypothetical protein